MKNIFLIISFVFLSIKPIQAQDLPRCISLAPSTTEILFALGLDDEIVAVSSFCNYPDKVKTKEKVGDFSSPNIEKIVSLRPDYIFCTGLEQAPIIHKLKRLNLKVYVADPKNVKELFETILDIGKITKREYAAQILVKNIEQELREVSEKVELTPQEKRPRVFIEIWHDPLTTAGAGSLIDEIITLAGGINIATDTKRPYSIFSPEEVIQRNPDCVILTYMEKNKPLKILERRLGWNNITAVKQNRVFNDIDPNIVLRPGPRIGKAVKEIYQRLYL